MKYDDEVLSVDDYLELSGYVKPEYSKVGTEICIDMRGRKLKAVVVKPPFRK